jgi:hypothetical protein
MSRSFTHLRILIAFVAIGASLTGCAASNAKGLPTAVSRERARIRANTYQVIGKGLGAGADGYTFHSARFRFEFSKEFDTVEGYRTPNERFERGKAASAFLDGGYDFVRSIFGVDAKRPIRVVIAPALNGNPADATTFVQWDTVGDKRVEGTEESTMNFGKSAFESQATLAHELTHALLSKYGLPAWMDEGIATLVEHDYANGAPWVGEHTTLKPVGLDANGYNMLQTWRGDSNPLPFRSVETYGSAYAVVKEIQRRYGDDVFVRLFRSLDSSKTHLRSNRLTTSELIGALNRVTGQQTERFFEELRFRTNDAP